MADPKCPDLLEAEDEVLDIICDFLKKRAGSATLEQAWGQPLPEGMAAAVPITRDIIQERVRQERLRAEGRFRLTCASSEMDEGEKLAVLIEEVGEVSRALLERRRMANDVHGKDLRAELVQVAAVCTAWVEALDQAAHQEREREVADAGA